ncbi:MAG: T9SS type A sorting domain-containing protein [Chitinophagaceae bacterium]|nr:T9SS type A sorting domain-containing protein [Chitinophagaceae bacterium]
MSTVNQLTGAGFILPVDLLSFSGYKDGSRNQLKWTTSTEQNNKGFEVQRSLDGVNYTSIGFVNSLAPGGSSSGQLNYTFADNSVTGSRQFYRLRQVDFDGNSKLSNIVLLKSDKPSLITIDGMFPNPATTVVNMMLSSPVKDKVQMVILDVNGRIVKVQSLNVEAGSNTLPVNVAALAGGTYMVKLISSTGEVSTGKLVKQ